MLMENNGIFYLFNSSVIDVVIQMQRSNQKQLHAFRTLYIRHRINTLQTTNIRWCYVDLRNILMYTYAL
jgi:hypothetical protein